jgi:histidinol-phosphate aminotransferase
MVTPDALPAANTVQIASNESVYGPGKAARAAAVEAIASTERYPEGAPEILAEAIGKRFKLDPSRICCGFGSDDLLARLARIYLQPDDELIYTVHGYPKVPNYAHANDAIPVAASDKNFTADVDSMLDCVTPRTRVVMLANPDNPTGTHVGSTDVRRLHAGLPSNVLLVLDSAYAEYVMADDYEFRSS